MAEGRELNMLVRLLAPTGRVSFLIRLVLVMLLIGAMNYGRDRYLSPYNGYDGYWNNFFEAAIIAAPFSYLSLAMVGHLNSLQLRLAHLAGTDVLTGLANRRAFMERAGAAVGDGGVFMMIDADHFKMINDRYGHDVGDVFLRAIADHIKSEVRKDDLCARFGGEEFAVFMPQAARADALALGQRLAAGVRVTPEHTAVEVHVTCSVGAAAAGPNEELAAVIRAADQALYQAKAAGRARLVLWDNRPPTDTSSAAA